MGPKVGWDRASENHHSGANSVNQVDGISDIVSQSGSVPLWGEGSEKGTSV